MSKMTFTARPGGRIELPAKTKAQAKPKARPKHKAQIESETPPEKGTEQPQE